MFMTQTNSRFGRRAVLATAGLGLATILGVAAAIAAPQQPQPSRGTVPPAPVVPAPAPAPIVPAPIVPAPVFPAPGLSSELSPASPVPGTERGFTRASDQSDLFFPIPGVVSKVYVKAGD